MQAGAQRPAPQIAGARRGRWRQYRLLVGCGLLAAAVLGYWAVGERPSTPTRQAARQLIPDRSLPEPGERRLDEVTIEQAGAGAAPVRFSLQRRRAGRPPGFYLTPPGSRADDAAVETLLSALLSTVVERRLEPAAAPARQRSAPGAGGARTGPPGDSSGDSSGDSYGFADGQCRVRVRFGAGHSLCFGGESVSGSVYVRAEDSPTVLVVDRGLFELLVRPPARYRASRVVPVPLRGAQQLEIGGLRISHDGDLWRVQEPGQPAALAEPTQLEELLSWLAAWSVVAWPADQPAATAATASAASTAARFSVPAGPPPFRLSVDGVELLRGGWPPPPGCSAAARLFVREGDEAVCAELPAGRRLDPAVLRAERLLPLTSAEIAELRLAPGRQLTREPDGTYTLAGRPAETTTVRRLLSQLTAAHLAPEPDSASPPPDSMHLVVKTTLGQQTVLRLWRRGTATLVQRDDEPTQRLGEPLSELFSLSELTFAPLQLATLEPAAVYRIERSTPAGGSLPATSERTQARQGALDQGVPARAQARPGALDQAASVWTPARQGALDGPREVLERAGRWQLREPTVAPADSAAVAALLAALVDLRAERWVSAEPVPAYGLAPPRLRLTLRWGKKESAGADPARELTLDLGGPASAGGDCYARRSASAAVAVLPAATCAVLHQPLLSPLVLRVDDDRLTAVSLTPEPTTAAALACTRVDGRWRCGGPELPTAARRKLLAALHGLEHGESPAYAAAPAAPPRLTLRLEHTPLTAVAAVQGEEVAPPEQTLRLYPAPGGGWHARLDQRQVSYGLPAPAVAALQDALAALRPPPP